MTIFIASMFIASILIAFIFIPLGLDADMQWVAAPMRLTIRP